MKPVFGTAETGAHDPTRSLAGRRWGVEEVMDQRWMNFGDEEMVVEGIVWVKQPRRNSRLRLRVLRRIGREAASGYTVSQSCVRMTLRIWSQYRLIR